MKNFVLPKKCYMLERTGFMLCNECACPICQNSNLKEENMVDLTKNYKINKEKLNEALKNLRNQKILGIYGVIASRIDNIHKCDLLIETEEDLLVFGDKLWNEPFFQSWTDNEEEYLCSGADVLVKEIKF